MTDYSDGTKSNPTPCFDWSEAFDCARERNRPVWAHIESDCSGHNAFNPPKLAKVFPSGRCEEQGA